MREGQRNSGAFKGLERDKVPSLRVAEAFQEIVRVCLLDRQRERRPDLHRQTEFMRHVWHRAAALALANFKVAHQAIDALLKCLTARDLDPVNGSWRYRGVDEIV